MTELQMSNSILENVVYYVIIAWKKEEYWSKSNGIAYKTERNAIKQAEREHAPDVAVRMTSNFKVQYYNTKTGEIVSTHY